MKFTHFSLVFLLILLITGAYFFPKQATTQSFAGAFNPIQAQKFTLAGAGVTSSAASVTVNSLLLPDQATKITMSMFGSVGYATIEPGTTKEENISFTGITQNASNNTATFTGVSRGLAFSTPYAASSTLAYAHAGGSYVIFSNSAPFYSQFGILGNAQTWGDINTYTVSPIVPNPTTATQVANKSYVDGVALVSAPNADTVTKGVVQIATGLQTASSTSLGSTAAILVIPSSVATDTPNTATRGSKVLMSQIGGYLRQTWLNLTEAFTFSGGLTSSGATNIAASNTSTNALTLNSIAYKFPPTQSASSTILSTDGAGSLYWTGAPVGSYVGAYVSTSTSNTNGNTYTQDTTYATPFQPNMISLFYKMNGPDGSGTAKYSVGTATFASTTALVSNFKWKNNTTVDTMVPSAVTVDGNNPVVGDGGIACQLTITVSSITSTGFTVTITHTGGGTFGTCGALFYPTAYR